MSNVVKAIAATDTGSRIIKSDKSQLFQDVFNVKEDIGTRGYHDNILKEYRIGITLGSKCYVSELDYTKHGDNVLQEAIKRTKQQVIEAIFGEFRQDFRLIERNLYNYEFEQAASALRVMERRMFSEE